MSVVQPKGEKMRQAVKWISSRIEDEGVTLSQLIERASREFNLSPMEEEFLISFYKQSQKKEE
ncbi:MAG: hypothetical protein JXO48_04560 [Deltaproteobacteria bacterium]|nr:hypothetical protein [Deltaproteobacteria bacterium]